MCHPQVCTDLNNASTTAYAASLVVKATTGKLYTVSGYNSKGSGQWIQIFDAASLPANNAIPVHSFTVATVANFFIDLGYWGQRYSTGIVVANSSTGDKLTVGSADCWIAATYY